MKRALFVDDDHDFIIILKQTFKDSIDATYVYTGAEGLEQLKYNTFDFVILDLMMFLDGVTFVKLANGRLKKSKVYFLSCLDHEEVERKIEPIRDRVAGVFDKKDISELKLEIAR